jgi:hypothetical protein
MESSTFVTDQFLTNVRNLIGYAIEAVHNGLVKIFVCNIENYFYLILELAAATMPVYLFNDLFAYTTIDISERIFVVMEEKASIWRSVCFYWKKFVLIRKFFYFSQSFFNRSKMYF